MKRWTLWAPLGVLVVVLVVGGSLVAHSVLAGNVAKSSFDSALTSANRTLAVARADGMFPSELQSSRRQLTDIEHMNVPSGNGVWTSDSTDFYNREAQRLDSIRRSVRVTLARLTKSAHSASEKLLSGFQGQIADAQSMGISVGPYQKNLRDARVNIQSASHLGQYRAIIGAVEPHFDSLSASVKRRSAVLATLRKQAVATGHYLVAARNEVRTKVAQAKHDLSVLAVFHPSPHLETWFKSLSSWAATRHTFDGTLIAASDLDALNDSVSAAVGKYVPAKWIFVSTENETISWYQRTTQIGTSLCTTGNPLRPTVTGHFSIIAKFSPFTFVSPDPPGSYFYYAPSPVTYAMEFQSAGYYIHDAPWRSFYGPGSDGAGQPGTNYGGTHGCVNVPLNVAAYLFSWAPMGTTVVVV